MATGKRLADFGELKAAEQALVEACRKGERCMLGDGSRPEGRDMSREIGAKLLGFLILGGGEDCHIHTNGVQLIGAYVTGTLTLDFGRAAGATGLIKCRFEAKISALQTRFELLSLAGSACPGLMAQGAEVTGAVLLRAAFHATGEVSLSGARVGGHLDCESGQFEHAAGYALNAQGAKVTGAVFLRTGFRATGEVSLAGASIGAQLDCNGGRFKNEVGGALNAQDAQVAGTVFLDNGFHATGAVELLGVRIGGQLSCWGGRFENAAGDALNAQGAQVTDTAFLGNGLHAIGKVSLTGAKIGGQLNCGGGRFGNAGGHAISAQRLRVAAGFFWSKVVVETGSVDLSSAHVGDLVDDLDSWPEGKERLYLDGFTYDKIAASFTDAPSRLKWLARGTVWNGEFHPQPYGQLARVLRSMGHDRAARQVLMERERLLAADQWKQDQKRAVGLLAGDQTQRGDLGWHWLRSRLARFWSSLIHIVAGYGHAPERALYCATAFLLFGTIFYFICWRQGVIVPNSPVILTSADWGQALLSNPAAPSLDWVNLPSARHYETFYSFPYTLDIFVPFVDLGQETAWSETTVTWLGWSARVIAWGIEASGWFISALAAAALTGLIQRKDD